MNEEILTVKELAEYLKLNPITIYRMVQKGCLPGFKVGGDWRFKKDSIERWIAGLENENGNGNGNGKHKGTEKIYKALRH